MSILPVAVATIRHFIEPVNRHVHQVFLRGANKAHDALQYYDNSSNPPAASSISFTEQRIWIKRTGWDKTHKADDCGLLMVLSALPSRRSRQHGIRWPVDGMANPSTVKISMPEDEGKITSILQAIDAVLDRCEETVRHTSRNILYWLKSTRPQSSYPKPFSLIHHDSTTKKYRWVWKHAVVFAICLYLLTLYGQKGQISIDLKQRQAHILDDIWRDSLWDGPTTQGQALSPLIKGYSKSRESGLDGYGSEDDAAGDEYQKEDKDEEGEEIEAKGNNNNDYTDNDNDKEDHMDDELNNSI